MKRLRLLRVILRRIVGGGVVASVRHAMRHPDRVVVHLRRLVTGDTTGVSNRYGVTARYAPTDRDAEIAWVAEVTRRPVDAVIESFAELEHDTAFFDGLRTRYAEARPEWAPSFAYGRFAMIYVVVRLLRPSLVIETGVHDGLSTTLVLKALAANDGGRLVSIDRPSSDLPISVSGAGWLVPAALRDRWELRVGDATRLLPDVATTLAPLDVFLHDSDHAPSHRRFEFSTVRPFLAEAGVILSDDDEPADGVMRSLGAEWGMRYVEPPDGIRGLGALAA